ncbi:MAG TPA: hypothetical protein VF128_01030 [Gemmatimonadaceae bacterium]
MSRLTMIDIYKTTLFVKSLTTKQELNSEKDFSTEITELREHLRDLRVQVFY